jgi:LytS/YehU family sensor histidine kinase
MIYTGIWALIIIIQTLAVHFAGSLPLGYAFVDSFVFNTIYACFIVWLWYPLYYNRLTEKPWYDNWMMHVVLAGLVLLPLWLGIGNMMMYFLFGENRDYLYFMILSVWWKVIGGIFFYIVFVLVCYLSVYINRLNEKMNNEIRLNQLIKDGELNLLKSQINPHFLFNSLNSVNSLIIGKPEQAQEMLVALSDYLRCTVLSTKQTISGLQEEIENIERYLSIEKLRFGNKLNYKFDIDPECFQLKIPSMLLQPLFENAIKHGVYETTYAVFIFSKVHKDADYLHIEIINDFDPDGLSRRKGSGIGLKNVLERLKLSYSDNKASLQTKIENGKFMVTVKIPIN